VRQANHSTASTTWAWASSPRARIILKGNLAGMLRLAQENKRPSETDDLLDQIQLVAGARNPLDAVRIGERLALDDLLALSATVVRNGGVPLTDILGSVLLPAARRAEGQLNDLHGTSSA